MYVSKVILRNIRGFADLEFDLERPENKYAGWTVFTGDNGSGKSTLLKAIAIGLTGKETARALQRASTDGSATVLARQRPRSSSKSFASSKTITWSSLGGHLLSDSRPS